VTQDNERGSQLTLRELYEHIGGDYDAAVAYLRSERLVGRLIVKFADDEACPRLFAAWESGDVAAAFEAAHEAKGVCSNLSLTSFAQPLAAITEALRPGCDAPGMQVDVDRLVKDLRRRHGVAVGMIREYAASL